MKETIGQRIARLRKEKGYSQTDIANKVGVIQRLVSDYERGRLRLNADIILQLSKVLDVSLDELMGVKTSDNNTNKINPKILKRLEKIEKLPTVQQKALFKTIDAFIKADEK